MQEDLTNQALPVGDVGTPIAFYSIYPRKKPALGRLSLVNNRTDHERANGWVCDVSVLMRRDDAMTLLDVKDAEIAALRAKQEAAFGFSKDEVDLLRQWGNSAMDVNPAYFARQDYALLAKITQAVGMRISDTLATRAQAEQPS